MKTPKSKSVEPAQPVDAEAVERLLSNPAGSAQTPANVALAAVEAARSRTLPAVLWVLSEHPAREVGKGARRALFLLKSRGVEVGARPAVPSVKAPPAKPEEASEPCRITTPDGFGDRALWVPLKRALGFDLWELILSDEGGVREVHRVELSRKQLRAHFGSLPNGGMGIYELPRSRAAGFLAEAIVLGGGPRELTEARVLLELLGGGEPSMALPVSAGTASPANDTERLAEGAALFDEPELRTFVPAEHFLRELAVKVDEVDVSPLLLDGRQKAERRQHVLDQAIEGYFTSERRALYARRLFEIGDHWSGEGRTAAAARASATARHLAGSGAILENPFARRMFHRIFATPPSAAAPETEKPAAGLIVPG